MARSSPPGAGARVLLSLVWLIALLADVPAISDRYRGRSLAEALRALQAAGLRIVFSSEIVRSELRVLVEPRSTKPIEILEELLRPHGLKVERGPSLVLVVVRPEQPAAATRTSKTRPAAAKSVGPAHSEQVFVAADIRDALRRGVAAEMTLSSSDLTAVRGVLNDDPVRAIQALPRVAAADDFASEFSVRGSAYRHVGFVVDGVGTPWLKHAAYGRPDAGSVSMVGGEVLEYATLQAGAYPQRDGDWLGAQLGVAVREGSRLGTSAQVSFNGISASALAEGPLGRAQRGSWLVAARQSYLDWPVVRRHALDETAFGFSDALTKVALDVRPAQKLSITALFGRSGVDGPDDGAPSELANGASRAALLIVRWDSTIGHNVRVTQQASGMFHRFRNKLQNGMEASRGIDGAVSYRVDIMRSLVGGLLEAGAQARRQHTAQAFSRQDRTADDRSGYLNFVWSPGSRFVVTPGVRLSHSTLASRPVLGRWILGQWSIGAGWTVNASAGVAYQHAELAPAIAVARVNAFGPERASHAEVGVSQRLGSAIRWQATMFQRREHDVIRGSPAIFESITPRINEPLAGVSRGFELLVERRATIRLSGWAAYSYGKSRYRDQIRQETFWGDFDQRHTLNVHAYYALSDRTGAALTFRGGSNFPIPGYLERQNSGLTGDSSMRVGAQETLVAGLRRNVLRLPPYARLDVRGQRTFQVAGRRVTAFVEVLNLLKRRNVGLADGIVDHQSGLAIGLTEPLLPRLPSAGLRIEF